MDKKENIIVGESPVVKDVENTETMGRIDNLKMEKDRGKSEFTRFATKC